MIRLRGGSVDPAQVEEIIGQNGVSYIVCRVIRNERGKKGEESITDDG